MKQNNLAYVQVGDISVTLCVEDGRVVDISAKDGCGTDYECGFAFRLAPVDGGGCMICHRVMNQWICKDVDCGGLSALIAEGEREKGR